MRLQGIFLGPEFEGQFDNALLGCLAGNSFNTTVLGAVIVTAFVVLGTEPTTLPSPWPIITITNKKRLLLEVEAHRFKDKNTNNKKMKHTDGPHVPNSVMHIEPVPLLPPMDLDAVDDSGP
eukprot:7151472-Alexandrium_andersonii.AAC.1